MLNNEDFAEEYEAEIITLEDDLGNEKDFEFLDTVEYEGEEYIILLPVEEEEQSEETGIVEFPRFEVAGVGEEGEDYDEHAVVFAVDQQCH